MEIPEASVSYNDYKGTSAASLHSGSEFANLLEKRGQKAPDECIVGFCIYLKWPDIRNVRAFLQDNKGSKKEKEIEIELTVEELSRIFKRFEVCLSAQKGMDVRTHVQTNQDEE